MTKIRLVLWFDDKNGYLVSSCSSFVPPMTFLDITRYKTPFVLWFITTLLLPSACLYIVQPSLGSITNSISYLLASSRALIPPTYSS